MKERLSSKAMFLKSFIVVLALFTVAIRASNVHDSVFSAHGINDGTKGNICYLTDVEGDLAYFNEYIKRSECLEWTDKEKTRVKFKNAQDMFIYGGDVTDKGTGSLRILRYLVEMKVEFGDRVELIIGNRDVNKMRFTTELSHQALDLTSQYSTTTDVVYWNPPNNITPIEWLTEQPGEETLQEKNTLPNRIKWMLEITMGSPGDFEFRQQELQIMKNADYVSDDDVAQSYMDQVAPDGLQTRYLKLGKLAVIKHNTLFTHGGILGPKGSSLGRIPNQSEPMDFTKSKLQDWVNGLNEFKDMELKKWVLESEKIYSKPAAGNMDEEFEDQDSGYFQLPAADNRAGISLIQYAPTKGNDIPSVIDSRQLDDKGMPIPLYPKDVEILAMFGVKNICSGHKPIGDTPTIIPSFSGHKPIENAPTIIQQVTTILADTSYSNPDTKTQKSDPRAKAVSEVVIRPSGTYMVHGVLSDGTTEIEYDHTDEWIGKELMVNEKKYIVKAKLKSCSRYTLMHVDSRKVEYLVRTADELKNTQMDTEQLIKYFRGTLDKNHDPEKKALNPPSPFTNSGATVQRLNTMAHGYKKEVPSTSYYPSSNNKQPGQVATTSYDPFGKRNLRNQKHQVRRVLAAMTKIK